VRLSHRKRCAATRARAKFRVNPSKNVTKDEATRLRAIVFMRAPFAPMHEFGAATYESDEPARVRRRRKAPVARRLNARESVRCERLAVCTRPRDACRGTAVAIRRPVARRVAAQFTNMRPRRTTAPPPRCRAREALMMLHEIVKKFANQEDGQDLLEYALLVALIALIAIGAVGLAGGAVNTIFTNIANALTAAA
jgi:pilus assembly protein Flp/PilA